MVYELNAQTIIIFAAFILIVFLLYKVFRVVIRAAIVGAIGFSFPWISQYLNLPLNIAVNIQTGTQFAVIAVGLYLAYEFLHFIKYFLHILSWPFRAAVKKK